MTFPIRTSALSKRFRRLTALDNLTVEVPEGAIYGLVGPNGAGKTTLIKTLMNIIPPTAGTAEVLGVDSRRLAASDLCRIGYVSENQQMPEWMTVEYLLGYLRPFYPTWDAALAGELVVQLGLPPQRRIKELSRGIRMKTALASSLAYRPKLIVLDEPFSGLDVLARDELIESLLTLAAGATVLISSHDLADIETFVSHIGYLDQGRMELSEEMSDLSARFREIEITFDAPPPLPHPWPHRWHPAQASAAMIRFIDPHFDARETPAEIRRLFAGVREIAVNPMPLRAIFIALAKAQRKAA
jgi:ABC-2 type transport system ATP-binding protein